MMTVNEALKLRNKEEGGEKKKEPDYKKLWENLYEFVLQLQQMVLET